MNTLVYINFILPLLINKNNIFYLNSIKSTKKQQFLKNTIKNAKTPPRRGFEG